MRNPIYKSNRKYNAGILFSCFIFLFVLISLIGQSLLNAITKNGLIKDLISPLYLMLSAIITYIIFSNNTVKENIGDSKIKPKYLIFATVLDFGMFCGLGFLNSAIVSFIESIGLKCQTSNIVIDSLEKFLIYTFSLCIMPAVFEEFVFRGMLFNSLSNRNKWYRIVVGGLCFSIYHFNFSQFLYQFIFGCFLNILRENSENILPCVFSHFLNNFVIILFGYIGFEPDFNGIVFILSGLFFLAVFLYFEINEFVKNNRQSDCNPNFIRYGFVGVLMCLVIMIGNLFL